MSTPVLYQEPAPALQVRSIDPYPARCERSAALADALFLSDLSARCEHTRIEVATAIRHAIGTHHGIGGCAAEVAAAYGEYPETAAHRMRWARAVVDGIDALVGWPGASS
jgi:hypothetical protein